MHSTSLLFSLFLIFSGAAVLSTLALITRQSLLVAYILLGVILGPWGLKLLGDSNIVHSVGNVGIIFLLFLLGLHLPPQKLLHTLKQVSWVACTSSLVFALIGYGLTWLSGYTQAEAVLVGAAAMFSSTIIGIKLLPTTTLHHQHTGELMISVLLLQDLLAIIVLLLMHGMAIGGEIQEDMKLVTIGLPLTLLFAFLFQHYLLMPLFDRFNRIREYAFLLAIAWCLSMSELASYFGLSGEIGAFIAGVTLATSPISLYIAESLKPVRDFFLVMFFFSVGANFNLEYLPSVILPATLLGLLLLVAKPVVFRYLLGKSSESKRISWEMGFRLGQLSEFSLIIAYVALDSRLIGIQAAYLIQATTILTFIASSYFVVLKYPTPVAISETMRRD
ncbi:MAG TPA: cation:proton antiporter [Coxiellaceae bacterium]|nr:cation:proton antiporter [Coxiellaceae bacterium]